MKMKDEKQKHNHKLTELLKICIFAILMIAPLLASVSQMLYVTLNKNAKDSYSGAITHNEYNLYYQYETNSVNNINDLQQGNIYKYTNYIGDNFVLNVDVVYELKRPNNDIILDVISMQNMYISQGTIVGGQNTVSIQDGSEFYFVYKSHTGVLDSYIHKISESDFLGNPILETTVVEATTLDNAFYYGVDQMTKSDLFNWTQNTAIYNGVKTMTDNLQIQTPAIAILIVYWFILTIIYIIIDIVLKCFTAITHMIFRAD